MKTNLNQDFDICEFKAIDNKLEVTCKYKKWRKNNFYIIRSKQN